MAHALVIQLARFGDLLQTKRLALSLAAESGTTVHIAVDASLAAVARLVYPFAVIHTVCSHGGNTNAADVLLKNRETFAALAEIPFTSVYTLNHSGMAAAMAGLFSPEIVRGYIRDNGQMLRSTWFSMAFRWMAERRIAPINLVDLWAYLADTPVAPAQVNPEAKSRGNGKIAVVPAGRESRRSLPPEVLAPLVDVLFAAHGGPEIILVGSAAEKTSARKLSRLVHTATAQKIVDTCGKTNLTDLAGILEECDLVLTPDTGVMHLASHLGTPVLAFFLSSAWCFETGPYGMGHNVFQATRSCAPCVESARCPYDTACLAPFSDTAVSKVLLGKGPGAWPDGLMFFNSACDAFGSTYTPVYGTMPELAKRAELRDLLAEYTGGASGTASTWAAERVFHESDWMLPREPRTLSPQTSLWEV